MQTDSITIDFESSEGRWTARLYPDRAPRTVQYFCQLIRAGVLDNTSIYRIVTQANQPSSVTERIEVIQGGGRPPDGEQSFDFLEHESTIMTGLKHTKYTLSMPRFSLNQVYKSFFITMGEFPCLDHGGKRHADGQGFAAFGEVVQGFNVLDRILLHAEEADMMRDPVLLKSVSIIQNSHLGG